MKLGTYPKSLIQLSTDAPEERFPLVSVMNDTKWPHTPSDIATYDSAGRHLGSAGPVTGNIYKPPAGHTIVL